MSITFPDFKTVGEVYATYIGILDKNNPYYEYGPGAYKGDIIAERDLIGNGDTALVVIRTVDDLARWMTRYDHWCLGDRSRIKDVEIVDGVLSKAIVAVHGRNMEETCLGYCFLDDVISGGVLTLEAAKDALFDSPSIDKHPDYMPVVEKSPLTDELSVRIDTPCYLNASELRALLYFLEHSELQPETKPLDLTDSGFIKQPPVWEGAVTDASLLDPSR